MIDIKTVNTEFPQCDNNLCYSNSGNAVILILVFIICHFLLLKNSTPLVNTKLEIRNFWRVTIQDQRYLTSRKRESENLKTLERKYLR